jgi:O-acetylhomoserine (thiol)-lyase
MSDDSKSGKGEGRMNNSFHEGDDSNGATTLPVWHSTGFRYESAEEMEKVFEGKAPGFVYTRIANPSMSQFERRMLTLEGGNAAISFASGMAAISTVILGLASSGDEIVSSPSIFGGTYSLLSRTLVRFGIKTVFVDPSDAAALEAAITDKTRAIFVETMGNPALDVPDIAAISDTAKKCGVALVVDNTVTTPVLFKPLEFGADIVVESTSKYINGNGTAIGGILVDSCKFKWGNGRYPHLEEFSAKFGGMAFSAFLRQGLYKDMGACFHPQGALMMSVGLDSLEVRMERHCESAMKIALALQASGFDGVQYPGLEDHRDHDVATRQFGGLYGGIITLRLGSKSRAFAFINSLKSAMIVANIGDSRTLVIHPASTFCREFDEPTRLAMGTHDDLVRISVGLESSDLLIEDITRALSSSESE